MNPSSKPIIPDSFAHLKNVAATPVKMPARISNRAYWTTEELDKLINLRAIGLSLKDCSKQLKKSEYACNSAVFHYDLYSIIESKKQELIKAVING
tara:strand:+ start:235 stop:522 length:288 start_codon:yes stop_codon:yes gene_type:complete